MADMLCPLCGHVLTQADYTAKDGRYRCPKCFEASAEAQKGWLPRMQRKVASSPAGGLSRVMDRNAWFAYTATGEAVSREQRCECGAAFTQRLLSERFLAMAERAGRRVVQVIGQQIPGYYVPVHCPRCERIDLGRQATIDKHRQDYHEPPFGDAADD